MLLESAGSLSTRATCCATTPPPHFHFPLTRHISGANLLPVRDRSGSGNLLVHLWRAWVRIWQHAACPAWWLSPSRPGRDILLGDDTKVAGPQGLPISMLVCVVNAGLNGGDKSQHPGLFLSGEVLLFQLLAPVRHAYLRIYAYI